MLQKSNINPNNGVFNFLSFTNIALTKFNLIKSFSDTSTITETETTTTTPVPAAPGRLEHFVMRLRRRDTGENGHYLNDPSVEPWPLAVPRPSREEVLRSRIQSFSPVAQSEVCPAPAAPELFLSNPNPVLEESLGAGFFENPSPSPSPFLFSLDLDRPLNNVDSGFTVRETVESQVLDTVISDQDNLNRSNLSYEAANLSEDEAIIRQITYSHRQRLISSFNTGRVFNPELHMHDFNRIHRFSRNSTVVPITISRHELIMSFFFRLFSQDILSSMGVIVMSGTLSSFFILYFFRRIFISILNPSFWSQIRTFEIREVLLRALRYVNHLADHNIYRNRPIPGISNSTSTSTSTPTLTRSGVWPRISDAVLRFRIISSNGFVLMVTLSTNALNARLSSLQAGLAELIRNIRAGQYWYLFITFGAPFLLSLVRPGINHLIRWVSGGEIQPTEQPTEISVPERNTLGVALRLLEFFTRFIQFLTDNGFF